MLEDEREAEGEGRGQGVVGRGKGAGRERMEGGVEQGVVGRGGMGRGWVDLSVLLTPNNPLKSPSGPIMDSCSFWYLAKSSAHP